MRKAYSLLLSVVLLASAAAAQSVGGQQQQGDTDIVRISTNLVQTDVVVTDKADHVISDLKLSDFELYDNGKKQQLKFLEFVSTESGRRTEGDALGGSSALNTEVPKDLTAKELKRVVAFVVDDLTIPIADMATVRQTLADFVNNKMLDGDLVAIVRVVGGKGLLQQFTSDRTLLRRAIASLNVSPSIFSAYDNPDMEGLSSPRSMLSLAPPGSDAVAPAALSNITSQPGPESVNDETQRLFRGIMSLQTANYVIDSLRELPGRKSLVLISGGIPIFEGINSGIAYSNVSYVLNQLTDAASRSGVVIDTLDPRGLKATPGVAGFQDTPGRSGLSAVDPGFGRGGAQDQAVFGPALAGGSEHLSLNTLSSATGGVAILNTNDFRAGLDKIMTRATGYYLLGYTSSEKFDAKFHKLQIKVKRDGLRVYKHDGYVAREDGSGDKPKTEQQKIIAAAKSPLAHHDVDVSSTLSFKLLPTNRAALNIDLLIDPKTLHFNQADSRYRTSFDVVGFVYDEMGRMRGGFSDTVNASLSAEEYQQALLTGIPYSANTELPAGNFQVRAVVRETSTGSLGTLSRYLEVPDLTNKRLTMSSVFLFGVNPTPGSKAAPIPLSAVRQLTRTQALRYAAMVYNAKQEGAEVRSQLIISQNGSVLFKQPEQPVTAKPGTGGQLVDIGELGLSKVKPGRYVLTLIITDGLADKKSRTVARSIDFTVAG